MQIISLLWLSAAVPLAGVAAAAAAVHPSARRAVVHPSFAQHQVVGLAVGPLPWGYSSVAADPACLELAAFVAQPHYPSACHWKQVVWKNVNQ